LNIIEGVLERELEEVVRFEVFYIFYWLEFIGNAKRTVIFIALKKSLNINNKVSPNEETVPTRESVINPRRLIHLSNVHSLL